VDAPSAAGGTRTNTITKLAEDLNVTTRTVRRDLTALQTAGFPIFDDTVNGTKFWRMDPKAGGAIARSGLTFSELCALYFSRALLECFAGTPMLKDLRQVRGGAFAGDEEVPRPAAAHHFGEGAAGEAPGHAELPDDGEAARSERRTPRGHHAVPLAGERA
jgi:hypothetical protein